MAALPSTSLETAPVGIGWLPESGLAPALLRSGAWAAAAGLGGARSEEFHPDAQQCEHELPAGHFMPVLHPRATRVGAPLHRSALDTTTR